MVVMVVVAIMVVVSAHHHHQEEEVPPQANQADPALLTAQIKRAQSPLSLLQLFQEHQDEFNHIHLSACWNALGHITRKSTPHTNAQTQQQQHLQLLRTHTANSITQPNFGARELANIAHGIAKSGLGDEHLMQAIATACLPQTQHFTAQQLANVAWALAKASHPAKNQDLLFDAIATQAAPRLGTFKPQEMSNLAWAYATAKHPAKELFDAIAEHATPRMHDFNEQSLSITFWAYATAKHDAPDLLDAITMQASVIASQLTPQALSTLAWACATAKQGTAQLLETVANEAKPRLRDFNAQQLSNSVWAFAKADLLDAKLFAALATSVSQRLGDFNSQDLASTAWGLAKACHVDAPLFASLARSAVRFVDDFNLQDLVNTAWAFAKVGQFEEALFESLAKSISNRNLDELDAAHIANIAWAFSKATQSPDVALFAALARSTQQRTADFAAADLATIAWSFANARQMDEKLFKALAQSAEMLVNAFTDEDRDNAEWAFALAGQQRIVKQLRQRRKCSTSATTASAAASAVVPVGCIPDVAASCGRIVVAGCGIGGAALAVALQSRGFDVLVLETDVSFDSRKQGYGLTIQGAEATHRLGINLAEDDAPSTSHYTFSSDGEILGFFGEAFGSTTGRERRETEACGRFVHIPRQRLRARIVDQIRPGIVRWGSKLQSFSCRSGGGDDDDDDGTSSSSSGVTVTLVDGTTIEASLLVGSDGIHSSVRHQLNLPGDRLNYVGLIVVLGIVPTVYREEDEDRASAVVVAPLAERRIFETVDGTTRIYTMPFTTTSTMWQLSFPYPEKAARKLVKDPAALKAEILKLCGSWHEPIPAMLRGTPLDGMSGYPVYDRQLLEPHILRKPSQQVGRRVTLMGDAAHPMTPFRAQGANQALSDAVLLSDMLADSVRQHGPSKGIDVALPLFEQKMLNRSARMVVGSREKAKEMHSALALQPARKVQRESGGGVDMHKAIGVLQSKRIGAHSVWGEGGLDAVVASALRSDDDFFVGDLKPSSKKRKNAAEKKDQEEEDRRKAKKHKKMKRKEDKRLRGEQERDALLL
ncbi:FAD_binding_3 domain-containing protein [Pycnococcus provasolii]